MFGFVPPFWSIFGYAKPAALCGSIAVVMVLIWPFFSNRKTVLSIQCIGSGAFSAHFLLIGAQTAAMTSLIALVQLLAATAVPRRSLVSLIYSISGAALVLAAIATWDGLPSVLAGVGSLIAMVARFQQSRARMNTAFLISAPFWATHNFLVGSIFGLTVDITSTTSLIIALASAGFGTRSAGIRLRCQRVELKRIYALT